MLATVVYCRLTTQHIDCWKRLITVNTAKKYLYESLNVIIVLILKCSVLILDSIDLCYKYTACECEMAFWKLECSNQSYGNKRKTKSDRRHYPYLYLVATVIKIRKTSENVQLRHVQTWRGLWSTATDNHNNNRDIYITLLQHSLLTLLYKEFLKIRMCLVLFDSDIFSYSSVYLDFAVSFHTNL